MNHGLLIRRAQDSDFDGIWEIFHAVVEKGDTYAFDPGFSIAGTVPEAFLHKELGLVDIHVMHRFL